MTEDFVPTFSGNKLFYVNPEPEQIDIIDIAHGLSMHPRFGGQTEEFFSVANHSILVSKELEEQGFSRKLQLYGLFHDGAEAYMGDIPAPLKKELDELQRIEEKIIQVIWEALGIEKPSKQEWKKVKDADEILLNYEASSLALDDGWADEVDRSYRIESGPIDKDRERFMARFRDLKN